MTSQIDAKDVSIAATQAGTRRHVLHMFAYSDLLALFSAALLGLASNALLGSEATFGERALAFLAALACIFAFRSLGHYRVRQALCDQIRPVLQVAGVAFLVVSTMQMMIGASGFNVGSALQWGLSPVLLILLRFGVRGALKAEDRWYEPILLVAPGDQFGCDAWLLKANDGHGLQVGRTVDIHTLAALDDEALGQRLKGLSQLPIFLAPDAGSQGTAARIASQLSTQGAEFYYKPAVGNIPTEKLDLLEAPPADGMVLRIGDSLDRPIARLIKRSFDLMVSLTALTILSPLLLIISSMIRRDGGPAIFVQDRTGLNGDAFGCYKFRTMAVDAEARLEAILASDPEKRAYWDTYQKLDDDPRITPVGRFLRATSLDELPQLLNVVKGEMSIVGPRPMMMNQMAQYGASLEAYVRMRPGITGLWQVNGRNATSFEERARLDNWYARNWSLWRDVVILVRTVREVFVGNGR